MPRRKQTPELPGWLWFFLVLPMTLIVALIWQRRRLPRLLRRARYVEPDSIPIDIRRGPDTALAEAAPAGRPAQAAAHEISIAEDSEETDYAEFSSEPEDEEEQAARSRAAAQTSFAGKAAGQEGQDDLKIIEGIGPAIARLLRENDITTFQGLADTPLEQLDEILRAANLRRLADPDTWSEQARFAAAGDWDGLNRFQGTLRAGRRQNSG